MAAYAAWVLPEEFAEDLYELAKEYNDAEICVERLSEGGTVITTLQSHWESINTCIIVCTLPHELSTWDTSFDSARLP